MKLHHSFVNTLYKTTHLQTFEVPNFPNSCEHFIFIFAMSVIMTTYIRNMWLDIFNKQMLCWTECVFLLLVKSGLFDSPPYADGPRRLCRSRLSSWMHTALQHCRTEVNTLPPTEPCSKPPV